MTAYMRFCRFDTNRNSLDTDPRKRLTVGRLYWSGRFCWLLVVPLCVALTSPLSGVCQDDPFAQGGGVPDPPRAAETPPANGPETLPPLPENFDPSRRLIIEAVRKSKLVTGQELAGAVTTLMDIEQYEDARFYLARLSQLPADDLSLFDLLNNVGSDFFLRIHSQPELQPLGREFARNALASAERVASNPERLDELLGKLNDKSQIVRQHALNQLRRVGSRAAARLLEAFSDPRRGPEFPGFRAALRNFGESAIGPLLAAVNANDIQVRYESLLALARIRQPDAYDATLRAALGSDTPAAIRDAVEKALMQTYGRKPQREQALPNLYLRATDQLLGRNRTTAQIKFDLNAATDEAWRWDFATKRLVLKRVSPETAGRLIALDRAADLTQLEPSNADYRQFYLLAYLDAAKRLVGPDTPLNLADVQRDLQNFTADEIDRALHAAVSKGLVPAVVGACDLLAECGTPELLVNSRQPTCSLVRAIQSGDRHAQFAALRAIAKIDPRQPYAGSSLVLANAVFLAGFSERPVALVGHNQVGTARNLALALGASGVSGRSVTEGKDFFQEATQDCNLRLLFVCDSLQQPDFLELVQQLRADWRTKQTPIAVLVEREQMNRAERLARNDSRMIVLPLTLDDQAVSRQLDRLQKMFEPWEYTPAQGRLHADQAIAWLLQVAHDRTNYRFYNLNDHQSRLADLLYASGHSAEAIQLLGTLNSPLAQRNLLSFASEEAMPIELRQAAVEAFRNSLTLHGILLTTPEISLQYERYEAGATQSGESQRVLGAILDMLERHRKEPVNR